MIQNPEVYDVKVHKTTSKWPFTSGNTASCEGWSYKEKKKLLNVAMTQRDDVILGEGVGGMGHEMKLFCPPFNSAVANSILITQHFCFDIGRIRHE